MAPNHARPGLRRPSAHTVLVTSEDGVARGADRRRVREQRARHSRAGGTPIQGPLKDPQRRRVRRVPPPIFFYSDQPRHGFQRWMRTAGGGHTRSWALPDLPEAPQLRRQETSIMRAISVVIILRVRRLAAGDRLSYQNQSSGLLDTPLMIAVITVLSRPARPFRHHCRSRHRAICWQPALNVSTGGASGGV
jgi:hypothetical protein